MTYVKQAVECLSKHLNPNRFTVIVNKSTVPVGTADLITSIVEDVFGYKAEKHFAVVSNPEFLREGFAVQDVFSPDRIVVGCTNQEAKKRMRELYQVVSAPYLETDAKSSEMIKYASHACLAVKISYINEIARLCEKLGANVLEVAKGVGMDSRIGGKFLQVSSGWSGSCFPKDTKELVMIGERYQCELPVVKAAIHSNIRMHMYCVEKVIHRLKTLNGKKIGILGLTFKPETDDARNTQATVIITKLLELGADIRVHDPQGMPMFRRVNKCLPVEYCEDAEQTSHRAEALLLLTHWNEYLQLDWKKMHFYMKSPYILDTRNVLPADQLREIGFHYEGLGC